MARGDLQDRQQRRALEAIETALRRSDIETALHGLRQLDDAARGQLKPAVVRLLHVEIRKAFAAQQWARLHMLASRVDRDARLLSSGGDSASPATHELEARWALLWGSALSKDWTRAGVQLEALRPALAVAPALALALGAWISASGQPARDALAEVATRAPDPARSDARLGFDRRARTSPGPQTLAEVEPRVLACFGTQPWSGFAATVKDWARTAPADVARPTWILAGQLAVRELLAQLVHGERRAGEPARFIARACKEAAAPPELAAEIMLALKVATAFFQRGDAADGDAVGLYAPIAEVAALYPDLVKLVEATVVDTMVLVEARPQILGLVEALARRSAAAPLWAKGLRIFAAPGPERAGPIPDWLVSGLARVLDHDGELAACLRDMPEKTRAATLDPLFGAMPLAVAERALDQLWRGADDAIRQQLAGAFHWLMERARMEDARRRPLSDRQMLRAFAMMTAQGGDVDADREGIHRLLGIPEIQSLIDDDDADVLRGHALELWQRFRDRVLPYGVRYLELALVNAGSPVEEGAVVDRYFAGRASIVEELRALDAACDGAFSLACQAIERRILSGHLADREALAVGLLTAKKLGLPRPLLAALARALGDADVVAVGPRSASVEAALLEARLFGPRRKRARAKRASAKESAAKPARAKPARAKRASAKPARAKRASANESAAKPASAKRATAKESVAKPASAKRASAKRAGVSESGVSESGVSESGVSESGASESGASESGPNESDATQPWTKLPKQPTRSKRREPVRNTVPDRIGASDRGVGSGPQLDLPIGGPGVVGSHDHE